MKKIILLLTILLTVTTANSQSWYQNVYNSVFDRINNLISEARKDNISNEQRISQFENAKELIQSEIDKLKTNSTLNVVSVGTQISEKVVDFSNRNYAIQKTDPSSGVNYYLYTQVSGRVPLVVKFLNNYSSLNYGDGITSGELHEGTYDNQMGYDLTGITTTHTYTKPGSYKVIAYGNMPSGKRAEVEIVVLGEQNQNLNQLCQKISQTLWEGKYEGVRNNQSIYSDVLLLQKFLKRYDHDDVASMNLALDGIYGEQTKKYVMIFQVNNGIKQTGAVGPVTLAKINSMICGNLVKDSFQKKDPKDDPSCRSWGSPCGTTWERDSYGASGRAVGSATCGAQPKDDSVKCYEYFKGR